MSKSAILEKYNDFVNEVYENECDESVIVNFFCRGIRISDTIKLSDIYIDYESIEINNSSLEICIDLKGDETANKLLDPDFDFEIKSNEFIFNIALLRKSKEIKNDN